jgi:hypothetical protein
MRRGGFSAIDCLLLFIGIAVALQALGSLFESVRGDVGESVAAQRAYEAEMEERRHRWRMEELRAARETLHDPLPPGCTCPPTPDVADTGAPTSESTWADE